MPEVTAIESTVAEPTIFPTISDLARYLCGFMEKVSNENAPYTRVKDGSPSWVREMIYSYKHANPDVREALNDIANSDDSDDLDTILDGVEADTYNSDLVTWLAEDLNRADYIDDGVKEYGWHGLMNAIQMAQIEYRREVLRDYYTALEDSGMIGEEEEE
jgi:hypothetical protein